jgi:hypothetical protein
VIFVLEKDDTQGTHMYYRALNEVTVENKYPLPRIDDILSTPLCVCVFSKINLQSG